MERIVAVFKRFQIHTNYSTILNEIGSIRLKVQDDKIPRFIHTINTETDCRAALSPTAEYVEIKRNG
ncbi:hypothetical protein HB847_02255 [Listeria booriae]|uniref:Uncharacterized protein n=1 Tax=Listeria booriae TaxID=1552123 RepID=A0A841Y4N1_9LIST|nr:hypothetical protein [Listeria booriae]MBC1371175.1 hypothetical protein [Listeria booriae]